MSQQRKTYNLAGAAAAVVAVLGIVFYLYRGTLMSMLDIWQRSDTYAHGWVIVPIALWLIWRQRDCIARVTPAFNPWGLVLMAVASLIWVAAYIIGAQVIQHFTLVLMVFATVLTIMGWQALRQLSFPLAFLIFAVPFGEILIPTLMEITAVFTVTAVQLTGIPVYRDGMFFALPSGDFEVAVACSGIRYLIASTALGTLYAYLSFKTLWKRILFMVLAILVPIVANGLRAFMIVMIAHFSELKLAVGIDHFIYGWVFFGVVMFVLFMIGARFQEHFEPQLARGATADPASAAATGFGAVLLVAIAIAVPVTAKALRLQGLQGAMEVGLPQATGQWRGPLPPDLDYEPRFSGATTHLAARYSSAQGDVHLYVDYYSPAEPGSELINELNRVYGDTWIREDIGSRRSVGKSGHRVIETPLRRSHDELQVWHWYEVAGDATVSGATVKLRKLRDTLMGRYHGSALVALAARDDGSAFTASALLDAFLVTHLDRLRSCLDISETGVDYCEQP